MYAKEPQYPHDDAATALEPESVLAVIPALREKDYIEACVRSLMAGEDALRRVCLVVADGGSTDGTVEIVKRLAAEFPNLKLLHNPKRLQSAAMNLAVEQFAGPDTRYVVRCDAHSIYPEGFILRVARSLQHTKAASVVIPMDATGQTCFEKANAWIVDTPLGSGGSAHRGGRKSHYVDHGHHAGFDIDVYRKIGGYDETFSHNEDAEYDERVAQQGGRIYLDADIRIAYVPRGTVRALANQYFNYGKGRARTVQKHGKRLKPRQALPILALAGCVGGLLAGPVFTPAFLVPAAYAGVLVACSLGVALWKRSACGLLAGIATGTMHMSWAAGFLKQIFAGRKTI
ncbi:MAG: glycosyltransferase family 2 protein [Hyphomonas sp.]|nr:glycosyltransferase family 2 protein [Hyphomonas sp.]